LKKLIEMPNKELHNILIERRKKLHKELELLDKLIESDTDKNLLDVYRAVIDGILESDKPNTRIESKTYTIDSKSLKLWERSNANDYIFWFKHHGDNKLPKKEDRTWKNYLIDVILELGGEARTSDIANFIILNNKDLTFAKARQIAADLLPELVEKGSLTVEKGDSKKEGHLYKIGDIGLKPVPILFPVHRNKKSTP
jgi:hypothetical protein